LIGMTKGFKDLNTKNEGTGRERIKGIYQSRRKRLKERGTTVPGGQKSKKIFVYTLVTNTGRSARNEKKPKMEKSPAGKPAVHKAKKKITGGRRSALLSERCSHFNFPTHRVGPKTASN